MSVGTFTIALTLAAAVYAWRAGGRSESEGAVILVAMLAVGRIGHAFLPRVYDAVDPVALIVDLVGFLGFAWLGIRARRFWPLWAASLQLLSLGAHFVRALAIPVRPPVYWWMKSGPSIGVVLLLMIGTWAYRRRHSDNSSISSPN